MDIESEAEVSILILIESGHSGAIKLRLDQIV